MKKLFAATTALMSVAMMAPAMAQESPIKLSLGGKLRHFFWVADQDELATERLNTAGMSTDAEFYLTGEVTLDSGLRVRAVMEEEAESRSDRNADEAYIDFRDTWGRFRIGEKEGWNSSFIGDPIPEAFGTTDERIIGEMAIKSRNGVTITDAMTFKRYVSDSLGIMYQTPEVNGFQAGIAYHPTVGDTEGTFDAATARNNAVDVSGRWQGTFGETRVRVGGGYLNIDSRKTAPFNDGIEAFNINTTVTVGQISIGGTYMDVNPANSLDEENYNIGILWKGYPWSFSADYYLGKRDATVNPVNREKSEIYRVQAGYKVGPGIDVGVIGFITDQKTGRATAAAAAPVKWDGSGVVVGTKLEF
ncbi:MAG: porin [Rhodospirillaceae bacterium]|nr:porin [Rhodospirillaceae bacterium]